MTRLAERPPAAPALADNRSITSARWAQPVLVGAILIGFAIRIFRVEAPSIWWDEGYSAYLATQGWRDIVRLTAADIHPPAYYFLLKLWALPTGLSEFALRYLSVLVSLLVLAVTYGVVRRILGRSAALLSVVVLAVAPYQWAFAQDARMYPLEALLGVIMTGLAYGVVSARPRTASLLAGVLAVVIALSLYVDYFPIVLVAALGVWVLAVALLVVRPWGTAIGVVLRFGVAVVVGLALYLPWLRTGFGQVAGYGAGRSTAPDAAGYLAAVWAAFLAGPAVVPEEHVVLLALAAVGLVAGWALWLRRPAEGGGVMPDRSPRWVATSIVLCWVAGSVAVLGAVLLFRPFFHVRYLSVAGPGMAVAVALALLGLWRWQRAAASAAVLPLIALAVVGAAGYHGDKRFARDDTRSTAAFLAAETTGRDLVLWQTPYPFYYYYHGSATAVAFDPNAPGAEQRLADLATGRERVFLETWYQSVDDPAGKAEFLLARGGRLLGERDFPGYHLAWYAVGDYTPPPLSPVDWSFGNLARVGQVAFGAAEGLEQQVPADSAVWVRTRWAAPPTPGDDLKYYVRLADGAGQDAGRVDAWVYDSRGLTSRHWQPGAAGDGFAFLRVPAGTPPGRYTVFLGAYLESGRQLGLVGGTTAESRLGEIEVVAPRGPQAVPAGAARIDGPTIQVDGLTLRLVGTAGIDPTPVVVGQGRAVRLLWQVEAAGTGDGATLRVGAEQSPLALETAASLAGWPVGSLVWQRVTVRGSVPGKVPVVVSAGGRSYDVGTLDVRDRALRRDLPDDITAISRGQLVQGLSLAGYRERREGDRLTVDIYWRAAGPFAAERKSFVHVLDVTTGKIIAQADAALGDGAAPADALVPGEILVDHRVLDLPKAVPFRLIVGVYDGATGAREPVAGGGDSFNLLTAAGAS